jgi:hypothetical protein
MLKKSKTIDQSVIYIKSIKIRITPLPLPECGWVVAASGCHIVFILRTIEGGANAPFEEKLDPYEGVLVQRCTAVRTAVVEANSPSR